MKVAVVGSGFMGQMHANAYAVMPGVDLIGICSASGKGKDLAERLGAVLHASYDRMLAEARPDVVSLCVPTHLHKEYTLKAAEAGVHVICEKPIATTLEDAAEMAEACTRHGVRLFVGHVLRFYNSYRDIRRKVQQGAIGSVGVVHMSRTNSHPGANQTWFNDAELSGGVIMDLLIHDIEFARSLLGEVDTVYAMTNRAPGVEYALVTLKFASGAIANLEGRWGHSDGLKASCEWAGKKGILRYDSDRSSALRMVKSGGDAEAAAVSTASSPLLPDPCYTELEHFISCIRNDSEPEVTTDDARHALELAIAAIRSAATGHPISMKGVSTR